MVREGETMTGKGPVPPLGDGARRLRAGELWPDYLGEEFCRVFSAARRFEAEPYHAEVPGLDYEWYLGAL